MPFEKNFLKNIFSKIGQDSEVLANFYLKLKRKKVKFTWCYSAIKKGKWAYYGMDMPGGV